MKLIPLKTALVTGSARRIGRALSLALAGDGYGLYLHYHKSREEAERLKDEIGERAVLVETDLQNAGEAAGLMGKCTALGPVTCLINNAATYENDAVTDFTAATFDRQMAVNLRAPVLLAQAFAAQLPPDQTGLIVNLLDFKIAALPRHYFTYTMAKAGLAAATEMMAQALSPRIRVCGIAPGLVTLEGHNETLARETPLGHGVAVEEIVTALRYLLQARSVTGEILTLDSGQRFASRRGPQP
jgi:NAD(P)-dependent dehydrogenase (short-subunit alcohol dehydrogenase family)